MVDEKPATAADPTAKPPDPWLEISASRHFAGWLNQHKIGIAFTTYRANKLLLLGVNTDGRLSIFERTFNRCTGLWAEDRKAHTVLVAGSYQIWRLENSLGEGETHQGYDRLYVPRVGYTIADLDVHDVAVEIGGRIIFANTLCGCIATLSQRKSFAPVWKPPFINKIAPDDRCHLSGLALESGKLAYVTCCSTTDTRAGWRDRRHDGGVVVDVRTNQIICTGLSMPHSPRLYQGKLYVHDSGHGYFGSIDRARGLFERLAFCPGYLRGLAFVENYAIVGLSKPREKTFTGLPLDAELTKRASDPQCGLQVIDLKTGDIIHWVRAEGAITELYDVSVLRSVIRPMALGFKTDEIQRSVTVDEPVKL